MIKRELKVLILGEVPEVGDIFERQVFVDPLPAAPIHIIDHDQFGAALEKEDNFDLVLIDIVPYGIEVLNQVREHRPACPVIMIGNADKADQLLEAKRLGLEAYLLRGVGDELFTNLLAEEIHTQLRRFYEPPKMESPSADQMYRYAQFHNVLEPFFVVARRHYLLYVNQAGRSLVQTMYDRLPVVGDPVDKWVLAESRELFDHHLSQAFSGHEVVHERDFEDIDDDGGAIRELHYQPVADPQGRVVAVSIAVYQTTHPELQRARSMQQITDFAAGVSHETNNLLNVLMSNMSLLSDRVATLGDEEANKRIQNIEKAIERSRQFTHQIQVFSRTSVSRNEPLDLTKLIKDRAAALNSQLGSDIDLDVRLEDELPEIYADRNHWKTVIDNLVTNGARAMADGGQIQVRTRSEKVGLGEPALSVGPGNYVIVEFIYEGQSMAKWMHNHNFDPFFLTRRVDHQTGLELATVKSIVEQGAGRIVAHRNDEETMLRIFHPTASASAHSKPMRPATLGSDDDTTRPTILVIEDEALLRETLADILRPKNYQVLTAATADEARDLCHDRSEPVDMMICDIGLPGGDGVALVEEIIERWPDVAIIFISGQGSELLPDAESSARRQIFLEKPISIPRLLEVVEDFFSGAEQ